MFEELKLQNTNECKPVSEVLCGAGRGLDKARERAEIQRRASQEKGKRGCLKSTVVHLLPALG